MANITITENDLGSVILADPVFRDDLLAFAGADTAAEGTILARKKVATTVTPAADAGNTGDGTCTAAAVIAGEIVPKVGAYVLTCIEAVANGGVFKLEDPDGNIVAAYLYMVAGAGQDTTFKAGGMTFTLTDGATDFAVGDFFTLTVAADGDLGYYAPDGLGGLQEPLAVLTYDVVATGAADIPVRVLRAGTVLKGRLILDADGDDSNITEAILDKLAAVGINAVDYAELSALDNS